MCTYTIQGFFSAKTRMSISLIITYIPAHMAVGVRIIVEGKEEEEEEEEEVLGV